MQTQIQLEKIDASTCVVKGTNKTKGRTISVEPGATASRNLFYGRVILEAGDAPLAFESGERFADEFENASTVASGLRVPKAIGDFLILDAIRASGGTAIAVTDEELMAAVAEIGAATGIFAAPEGAACLPALRKLIAAGQINSGETVVLFNTGSGIKYMEAFD